MHLTPLIIVKFARHVKVLACILGFLLGGQYAPESSASRRMDASDWEKVDVRRPGPGPCWSAITVGYRITSSAWGSRDAGTMACDTCGVVAIC
jgi:hypothetical protein